MLQLIIVISVVLVIRFLLSIQWDVLKKVCDNVIIFRYDDMNVIRFVLCIPGTYMPMKRRRKKTPPNMRFCWIFSWVQLENVANIRLKEEKSVFNKVSVSQSFLYYIVLLDGKSFSISSVPFLIRALITTRVIRSMEVITATFNRNEFHRIHLNKLKMHQR